MTPADPTCAVITTILTRVKTTGKSRAWVCVAGWVGTHQNDAHHWSLDDSSSEKHYYRAFWVPWLVSEAKKSNLAAAKYWYIDAQGRACMANDIDLKFDLAVKGYADPQRYPKDSDKCSRDGAASSAGGGGGDPLTASAAAEAPGGELLAMPIALDALGGGV